MPTSPAVAGFLMCSIAAGAALESSIAATPPPTRVDPVVDVIHSVEIQDNFRWLESLERQDPEVKSWTDTQNAYTRSVLGSWDGREALETDLAKLMSVGATGAPIVRGTNYFFTQRAGDQNQPVLKVRRGPRGETRDLLDVNSLDDEGLKALDWFVPSPDGRLIAFGLSVAGDEMTVLHLMDSATGTWLSDSITGKVDFGGWAPDGTGFLYGVLADPSNAYSRTWKYHELGRHQRHNPVLFTQDDPSEIPGAQLSRNGRWIVLQIFQGWAEQDLYVFDAIEWLDSGKVPTRRVVAEGIDARFEPMEIVGDQLLYFTTLGAPKGRLMGLDLADPESQPTEVIPGRVDEVLTSVSQAGSSLVARYEKDAAALFRIHSITGEELRTIDTPVPGQASITSYSDRSEAYMQFTSFNTPPTIFRLDILTGVREEEPWATTDIPNFDSSAISVSQQFATSPDGTRVPMFIVHKKDMEFDGSAPTLMYGYGGFDISIMPRFRATDIPWLMNGGVYVSVNLRGGGEYGEEWHRGGMRDQKQNVFDDLYAAAEHLIARGITSPEHLAVLGGSNGGLLTGVAAVQRPDLFAAAVSAVPLLDMIRFPDFLMARFWIPEYGNPSIEEEFNWIRAYSPYHNVVPGTKYPAMLITAGENDNRVHPMHARKQAALMQKEAGNDFDEDPILLWVDRQGGHGQGKPLALRIRDSADIWSFVMWQTGMNYGN
ncbi:MAG: prolyl oligopeptidase family protein [Phycisphaerales bacterium]